MKEKGKKKKLFNDEKEVNRLVNKYKVYFHENKGTFLSEPPGFSDFLQPDYAA